MNPPLPQNQIILVAPQQALAALSSPLAAAAPPDAAGGPPSIDFSGMWNELRHRWLLVVLCAVLGTACGLGYALKAPKIFEAKATIEVDQEPTQVLAGTSFGATDVKALEVLKTIEQKLAGETMLLRIIRSNGLDKDATFAPPRNGPYHDDELVYLLGRRVSVTLQRGTRLIDIRVEDTDPARAKRIADSFLAECTTIGQAANGESAKAVRTSLEKQKEKIRQQLDLAQRAVDDFRSANPSVPLQENQTDLKTNLYEDRIKTLGQQISVAREEAVKLGNGMAQIRAASSDSAEALLRISAIANVEEIMTLRKQVNDKKFRVAELEARYLPKWPPLIRAKQELASGQENLLRAAQAAAGVVDNRLAQAQANAAKLESDLEQAKKDSLAYQKIADSFSLLTNDLKVQQEHYRHVLTRMKEAEVSQEFAGSILRAAGVPLTPTSPIRPNRRLIVAGAGFAGVLLGIGLAMLLRLLDQTVRTLSQGEKDLALPGLAAIPLDRQAQGVPDPVHSAGARLETAEAFRALRTSLSLLGKGVNARSFLFTSASPDEGKSYCAKNFAVALAQQGYRTLLIDADLRNPGQDEALLGRRNAAGLISHLKGADTGEQRACNPTRVPNLFLFSAGEAGDAHPAELLSGQAFSELLSDAIKWFHKIVIDTPPVNAVSDALLLAREVDSVVLVTRADRTGKSDARQAIGKLNIAGNRPVGFVLNAAPRSALVAGYTGGFSCAQPPLSRPLLTVSSGSPA